MRWHHTHSWAIGVLTGIIISQQAILLVLFGVILSLVFVKFGAVIRAVGRRWAIRP